MEADGNSGNKIATFFKKLRDAVIKFFTNLKDKIFSLFGKKEYAENIDKLDKACKRNPLLGRKKIIVKNIDASNKVCDEHQGKLKTLMARIKSGKTVDKSDIDEVRQSFLEKHGKAIGIGAAVTITLGTAIVLLRKFFHSSNKVATDSMGRAINTIKEAEKGVPYDPNYVQMQGAAALSADIEKKRASEFASYGSEVAREARKALSGVSNQLNFKYGPGIVGKTTKFADEVIGYSNVGMLPEYTVSDYDEIPDCFMTEFYDDDLIYGFDY